MSWMIPSLRKKTSFSRDIGNRWPSRSLGQNIFAQPRLASGAPSASSEMHDVFPGWAYLFNPLADRRGGPTFVSSAELFLPQERNFSLGCCASCRLDGRTVLLLPDVYLWPHPARGFKLNLIRLNWAINWEFLFTANPRCKEYIESDQSGHDTVSELAFSNSCVSCLLFTTKNQFGLL